MRATISLFNQKGDKISDLPLDQKVFDGKVNFPLLHQVVRMHQANARQGTHATKTRGEVRGGGKKPWRQKGTGRARAGSIRSPLWRHGGTTFGPHPRDYSFTIPKQMKQVALRSGLNAKVKDGEVVLVEKLEIPEPKTKIFVAFLSALKIQGKVLVVVEKMTSTLKLSHRNVPGVVLKSSPQINAYDLLRFPLIVMEKAAFATVLKACEKETS